MSTAKGSASPPSKKAKLDILLPDSEIRPADKGSDSSSTCSTTAAKPIRFLRYVPPKKSQKCLVFNCSAKAENPNVTFLPLPDKHNLRHTWLVKCGRRDLLTSSSKDFESVSVCSAHFAPEDFANKEKTKVKGRGLPKIFQPNISVHRASVNRFSIITGDTDEADFDEPSVQISKVQRKTDVPKLARPEPTLIKQTIVSTEIRSAKPEMETKRLNIPAVQTGLIQLRQSVSNGGASQFYIVSPTSAEQDKFPLISIPQVQQQNIITTPQSKAPSETQSTSPPPEINIYPLDEQQSEKRPETNFLVSVQNSDDAEVTILKSAKKEKLSEAGPEISAVVSERNMHKMVFTVPKELYKDYKDRKIQLDELTASAKKIVKHVPAGHSLLKDNSLASLKEASLVSGERKRGFQFAKPDKPVLEKVEKVLKGKPESTEVDKAPPVEGAQKSQIGLHKKEFDLNTEEVSAQVLQVAPRLPIKATPTPFKRWEILIPGIFRDWPVSAAVVYSAALQLKENYTQFFKRHEREEIETVLHLVGHYTSLGANSRCHVRERVHFYLKKLQQELVDEKITGASKPDQADGLNSQFEEQNHGSTDAPEAELSDVNL